MTIDPRLRQILEIQPYPLLFTTTSGAHLYGFPSGDSDYDLRGAHLLPPEKFAGLDYLDETVQDSRMIEGLDLDLVTHDVGKFFRLMLKKNGYVLEQLFSPLIIHTSPEHGELANLGKGCITKHHSHHYLGFSETQWKLFEKETPRRVKPLLYAYRVLLTGIHLMRSGIIEANLCVLNEEYKLPQVKDLLAQKLTGSEKVAFKDNDFAFHETEYMRLRGELETAHQTSALPEVSDAKTRDGLNSLLIRLRKIG
ncbi:MAG: DNA polymerase beta superfamily protein [Verrucomicrobiales bacterium]